ncbi:melanoma-associated antigen B5-like [Eptesicus fuscus]|uniref:melanoma-associated antigen B5-like n=1 Tax=Eptesicus fuscus TaxID=29078 RepID=UPI00240462FF|nr:melanoma-associated antigen B5-like [Eptesicus fuscus]
MPRRRKNKKRHHARSEPQSCGNAPATAEAEEESTPSFSTQCEGIRQGLPVSGSRNTSQGPQSVLTTTTTSVAVSCPGSGEAFSSQDEDEAVSSETPLFTEVSEVDEFKNKTVCLEQFILNKYKLRKPILKDDMLHIIGKDYQHRFAEMLKKVTQQIETFFALDMYEVDSTRHSYALVSKLKLPNNGRVRPGRGLPKTGLLMHILGMIFMNGNSVSEEEVWRDLRLMRVYPRRKHFVFGEPRKLITNFLRLKYLECRRVPDSDPPCYEFLWGPKAYQETSKLKVLEFWAKVNGTHPSAFPYCYQEALRDEEERARARVAARAATTAQVTALSRAMARTTLLPIEKSKAFRPSDENI